MKLFNTRFGYLMLAMIALIFSAMGFTGLLGEEGAGHQSIYFGALFLSAGIFFLVCFFKRK